MDIQKLIDSMNEQQAKDRGNYHLNYGQLIDVLKSAPKDAVVDERIKGIGSWRGSYIEIAIFTEDAGYHAERSEFTDYGGDNWNEKHKAWEKENVVAGESLPTNANELGELLESLLGLEFVGWKGGNFTIERYKPIWLTSDAGSSGDTAVIGIDENLKLVTKEIDND
jgi:hypothetical protein